MEYPFHDLNLWMQCARRRARHACLCLLRLLLQGGEVEHRAQGIGRGGIGIALRDHYCVIVSVNERYMGLGAMTSNPHLCRGAFFTDNFHPITAPSPQPRWPSFLWLVNKLAHAYGCRFSSTSSMS